MSDQLQEYIKQTTFIQRTPQEVFDAITSADVWNAFFTHNSTLDPSPGGAFIWRWKDWGPDRYTLEVSGTVIEATSPERFVFEWGSDKPTRISMVLSEQSGGTVLRLTEQGYANDSKGRAMALECAAGWGEAITLLKFYLEHGLIYTTPPTK